MSREVVCTDTTARQHKCMGIAEAYILIECIGNYRHSLRRNHLTTLHDGHGCHLKACTAHHIHRSQCLHGLEAIGKKQIYFFHNQ